MPVKESPVDQDGAMTSKAWPFLEARRLAAHLGGVDKKVVFATGYGPSGLPHIGTFAEVVRTQMIRRAWREIGGDSVLYVFSDDMDGLRKVPDNIPRRDRMAAHIDKPLSAIPDPFGCHASFADHNNALLCDFLDRFGFDYRFCSATAMYQSGAYDATLRRVLAHHDTIRDVVAATLGKERRATYSPFLPICPDSGRVLQAKVVAMAGDHLTYCDPDGGKEKTISILGGRCKLQWKADWAMRWVAMSVDYEMAGKDLRDSVQTGSKISRILGRAPPLGMIYELFLDEKGEKISKSRGNGLEVDSWLEYGTEQSLAFFMYHAPTRAKRLYFDIIPRMSDDHLRALAGARRQSPAERYDNPAWHVHGGDLPADMPRPAYSMLLNLASAADARDEVILWNFLTRYDRRLTAGSDPILDAMVAKAVRYYHRFVAPHKRYRLADAREKKAIEELSRRLAAIDAQDADRDGHDGDREGGADRAEAIQNMVYEIGKEHNFSSLKDWFSALYEILLGQNQGPRMGSFIAFYGIGQSIALIHEALSGKYVAKGQNAQGQNTGGQKAQGQNAQEQKAQGQNTGDKNTQDKNTENHDTGGQNEKGEKQTTTHAKDGSGQG